MSTHSYISTAIPYVNANPHIGFALEVIQADTIARYRRSAEQNVFFLAGSDENSLKNVQAAEQAGVATKDFVDEHAGEFAALKDMLHLSYDDFIRTTEPRHIKGAQKLWRACQKDIYKKSYQGLYCVGCEAFYKENELKDGLCPEHKTKPQLIEEENYFFRLSAYADDLKRLYTTGALRIVPDFRANEVLSFISSGLEDFSISRSAERARGWGIPVPNDEGQIMYVWFDALTNYINALGYAEEAEPYQTYWDNASSERIHVIGKGILRFHALYWPAMLLSAGVRLPTTIFVHGYITAEGEKMSKSLGNVITPEEAVAVAGIDAFRYFMLREISPFEDGDYSHNRFIERYNADLAHGLGNLVSRALTLMSREEKVILSSNELADDIAQTQTAYAASMKDYLFNASLEHVWKLIATADKYINDAAPWKMKDRDEINRVLSSLWYVLSAISELIAPAIPDTAMHLQKYLKIPASKATRETALSIEKPEPLFAKLDI